MIQRGTNVGSGPRLIAFVLVLTVLGALAPAAGAQTGAGTPLPEVGIDQGDPAAPTGGDVPPAAVDTPLRKALRYGTLFALPTGVLVYGMEVWDWGESSEWRWGNEGWFGAHTDNGGADKMGHAYAHYLMTRLAARVFDYTEAGGDRKYLYSGLVAGIIGFGIEFGDSFTGRYGFSGQDLTMDALGIALGIALERYPLLDGFIGFSAQYWPTEGFLDHPNASWLEAEADSSGWRHMLNFRFAGFEGLGYDVPWYLRYLQVDFGYFSRGYTRFDSRTTQFDGSQRYAFVGLSLNFMEVSDQVLGGRAPVANAIAQDVFRFVHVPLGATGDQAL